MARTEREEHEVAYLIGGLMYLGAVESAVLVTDKLSEANFVFSTPLTMLAALPFWASA